MNKYNYKARDPAGKKAEGIVEAANEKQAVAALRQRDLIVVFLKRADDNLFYKFKLMSSWVGFNDVVIFTRQLSTMINAGLSLTGSLSLLADQSKPAMGRVVSDILRQVQGGTTLYKAMSSHPKVFSKVYLALIKSGEAGGVLEKVLKKMAGTLEKQREFKAKVTGAMIYPSIVVTGMVIVGIIMMVAVLPKMLDMYKDFEATLPMTTRILISFMNFMKSFWFVLAGAVVFGVYALRFFYKTEEGRRRIDKFVLSLPIIGVLQQKVILTNTTRTLGMLLGAGVGVIESLQIVSETANNAIYEEALITSAKAVEKGLPLAGIIGRYDFFPPLVPQMISVGEETGKLDAVLNRLARHFESESEIALKAVMSAVEPLMMVVLGVGVGFLVIAIIMPIYSLTSQFG